MSELPTDAIGNNIPFRQSADEYRVRASLLSVRAVDSRSESKFWRQLLKESSAVDPQTKARWTSLANSYASSAQSDELFAKEYTDKALALEGSS